MKTIVDIAQWVEAALFVVLGYAALRQWQRRRDEPARWLAATFGVLAIVVIAGRILPQTPNSAVERWVQKIDIVILLLFPYFLFRFAAAFEGAAVGLRRLAAGLTAALAVWTLLLPRLPGPKEARPGWYEIYVVALLAVWTVLSVIVAVRLWRGGQGQPAFARRRMRLLSLGSILLDVALLIAGSAPNSNNYGVQVTTQVIALASAVVFFIGFSPPTVLRVVWRRPELDQLRHAEIGLMAVTTREGIAGVLLPYVTRLLGGRAAALVDPEGNLLASHGLTPDGANGLARDLSGVGNVPPAGKEIRPGVLALAMGSSKLGVELTPYTPFFGEEELMLVQGLGLFTDLALERASLFHREREAQEALAQANTELEALLYSVSHDLKSPLISLLGYLEYLKTDYGEGLNPEAAHYVDRMTASAAYMQQLIQDLLELSRIGRTSTDPSDVDLTQLVDDIATETVTRNPAATIDVTALPVVRVNPLRARQLFTNLIENAVAHAGRLDVHVRVEAERSPGGGAVVVVRDDGRGVPVQYRDRVFGVFERLGGDETGTGVGLAICRKIVEQVGGQIWMADVPTGAEIRVELPAVVVRDWPRTLEVAP